MINLIKKIFGIGPATNYVALVEQGAIIIDVRSPQEYKQGHLENSINIPLNELNTQVTKFKKDSVIITCCASGMRSASAKGILQSNGFQNVFNGGGWTSLKNKIS
ncbi:rhodanese-like domain-containing protein [Flavobacterium sp.]|uniref:rhodanese-like domain-containing protein n=1 Tax=Flavobacterium sp. TaxID=239 RepID=UPI0026348E72|nr:rhodanese-like domain-containing protein [Flavobacterium sp.]MDG2431562.1 rhodanese-like domain-containing protein [Flavobacterium sp.]